MTPERKEWWDNLPQKEKELREAIAEHEKWIKINKSYLPDGSSNIEYVKKMLRRQKLIVQALKHELERWHNPQGSEHAEAIAGKMLADMMMAMILDEVRGQGEKKKKKKGKKLKKKAKNGK